MTTIHKLKIDEVYLDALLSGEKTFEIRYNDRGYQRGDTLNFHSQRLCKLQGLDCGGESYFNVLYVHSGLGLEKNYVAMAVLQVNKEGK